MAKWADYCISAVRYDHTESHIDRAKVHADDGGDTLGVSSEWIRSQVISAIQRGHTFVTIYSRNRQWHRGEDVRIITMNGTKYIRTDTNYKAADNLGTLPRF